MQRRSQGLRYTSRLILVLLLLGASIPDALAKNPPSYVLMCRGGGDMTISFFQPEDANALGINFIRAPSAASVSPPGPGQCAWLDRPLSAEEPTSIYWKSAKFHSVQIDINARKQLIAYYTNSNVTATLSYLVDSATGGQVFQVHVFNKAGKLHVTRVGP
jgi:hypothetical protein